MTDTKQQRYERELAVFGQPSSDPGKQLMAAICLTQLKRYPNALHFYRLAVQGYVKNRRMWHGTSQPDDLVNALTLADQPEFYPQVREETETYKIDPRGDAPVALYSYALVRLIAHEDEAAGDYVPGLFKTPKIKDTFATGKVIKTIIERDQLVFESALEDLLKAHQGMAKFGSLRETPRGFLCLPAMSLSKMALERGMEVNVESEYLSKGYLAYLLHQQSLAF
jgi:hypothetical protein